MTSKVLLVDDDPEFRAVLALALKVQGYHVLQAAGGQQALEFLNDERPDIIISDLEMSGVDGRELCKHVRRDPILSGLPFVILSAFLDPEGSRELDDLPADYCLSKQVPISRLVRLVEELIKSSSRKTRSATA